jgi:hypothetical protein
MLGAAYGEEHLARGPAAGEKLEPSEGSSENLSVVECWAGKRSLHLSWDDYPAYTPIAALQGTQSGHAMWHKWAWFQVTKFVAVLLHNNR